MKTIKWKIILLFLVFNSYGKDEYDPELIAREEREMIYSMPVSDRKDQLSIIITAIENQLQMGKRAGYARYGAVAQLAESLGKDAQYEKYIEGWFGKFADIDPELASRIYNLKSADEWSKIFVTEYPKITNDIVKYRIRSYLFSEGISLKEDIPNNGGSDLSLELSPVDDSGLNYKINICNNSSSEIYVFPQTVNVETEWTRTDGVPLPRSTSLRDDANKQVGVIFLLPGDSLERHFSLKVLQRDRIWYKPTEEIIFKTNNKYTFINGVCVGVDGDNIELLMRVYLHAFDKENATMNWKELEDTYKQRRIPCHIVEDDLYSGVIKICIVDNVVRQEKKNE